MLSAIRWRSLPAAKASGATREFSRPTHRTTVNAAHEYMAGLGQSNGVMTPCSKTCGQSLLKACAMDKAAHWEDVAPTGQSQWFFSCSFHTHQLLRSLHASLPCLSSHATPLAIQLWAGEMRLSRNELCSSPQIRGTEIESQGLYATSYFQWIKMGSCQDQRN